MPLTTSTAGRTSTARGEGRLHPAVNIALWAGQLPISNWMGATPLAAPKDPLRRAGESIRVSWPRHGSAAGSMRLKFRKRLQRAAPEVGRAGFPLQVYRRWRSI